MKKTALIILAIVFLLTNIYSFSDKLDSSNLSEIKNSLSSRLDTLKSGQMFNSGNFSDRSGKIQSFLNLIQSSKSSGGGIPPGKRMCPKCKTFLPLNWAKSCPRCGNSSSSSRIAESSSNSKKEKVTEKKVIEHLKGSLYSELSWVKSEQNTPELWEVVKMNVEVVLSDYWKKGVLKGNSALQAFSVKCDTTTMNNDEVKCGILKCMIGVAAIKPSKFSPFELSLQTSLGAEKNDQIESHNGNTNSINQKKIFNLGFNQKVVWDLDVYNSFEYKDGLNKDIKLVKQFAKRNGFGSNGPLRWYKRGSKLWSWKRTRDGSGELLSWPGSNNVNRNQPVDFAGDPLKN